MSVVFADSGYWVALINALDGLRAVARRVSGDLGPIEIVTSEMVLVEVLNHFSRLGPRLRGAACPPRAYPARFTSFARAPFDSRKGLVSAICCVAWCDSDYQDSQDVILDFADDSMASDAVAPKIA